MKLKVVGSHAYQFTKYGFVNGYLVEDIDGLTLIDAMLFKRDAGAMVQAAASLGQPIRRILITHAHPDHIGALDALSARLPGVTVAVGQRESLLLAKPPAQDLSLQPGEPAIQIKPSGFPGVLTRPTRLLSPGELFGSLRCMNTPGHSPGHMSYLDERDGTLFAGDALMTIGGSANVPGFGKHWFPRLVGNFNWNSAGAVESVRGLLDVPFARLAPGHGQVLEGGRGLIESALAGTSR